MQSDCTFSTEPVKRRDAKGQTNAYFRNTWSRLSRGLIRALVVTLHPEGAEDHARREIGVLHHPSILHHDCGGVLVAVVTSVGHVSFL